MSALSPSPADRAAAGLGVLLGCPGVARCSMRHEVRVRKRTRSRLLYRVLAPIRYRIPVPRRAFLAGAVLCNIKHLKATNPGFLFLNSPRRRVADFAAFFRLETRTFCTENGRRVLYSAGAVQLGRFRFDLRRNGSYQSSRFMSQIAQSRPVSKFDRLTPRFSFARAKSSSFVAGLGAPASISVFSQSLHRAAHSSAAAAETFRTSSSSALIHAFSRTALSRVLANLQLQRHCPWRIVRVRRTR